MDFDKTLAGEPLSHEIEGDLVVQSGKQLWFCKCSIKKHYRCPILRGCGSAQARGLIQDGKKMPSTRAVPDQHIRTM